MWLKIYGNKVTKVHTPSALDHSCSCRFSCDVAVVENTIRLLVDSVEHVRQLELESKHTWCRNDDGAFCLLIDLNDVYYVKIHNDTALIFCRGTIELSITINFHQNNTMQFKFVKNLSHYHRFQYLFENYYENLIPKIPLNYYRRLFFVQGLNVPVYYVNTTCTEWNNVDLSKYCEIDCVIDEIQMDYVRQLKRIKLTLQKHFKSEIIKFSNFEHIMNIYTTFRFQSPR